MSRETAIGVVVTVLAVAAMAVDHLIGDDPGLEDPPTFAIASGVSVALAAFLFGRVVPRARSGAPEAAAKRGIASAVVAVIAVPLSLWLGLPFILGGAAVALGLLGRRGERRRLATAALVIGAIVVVLGTGGYVYEAARKLS